MSCYGSETNSAYTATDASSNLGWEKLSALRNFHLELFLLARVYVGRRLENEVSGESLAFQVQYRIRGTENWGQTECFASGLAAQAKQTLGRECNIPALF